MGYSKKAIKGLGWVSILQIISKGIIFVKFVIIARFLSPSELGLFGVSMLTIGFFQSMTETGISAFLIHKENIKEYISSAWIISMSRGFILFLLTAVLAYPISAFFNSPNSFPLILLAGLIPLIGGFINPASIKFQKNLDFDKQFLYRFTISISDFLATVILLLIFKNAFALILGLTVSIFTETFLSLIFIKPRPNFKFEIKKITELFHFGKWLTLVVSANYFSQQIDSIAVGKILGVSSLGVYQLAQSFSLQIMSEAGDVFSTVTFPLFAKIKEDRKRIKRALSKILILVSVVFGSISVFLIIFSKFLLISFVGEKWIGADLPLKIFSLTGLITAFMAVITSLFLAKGKQDITARIILTRLIILVILIVPVTTQFGIVGTSIVSLLSYILVLPLALISVIKILKKS